MTTASTEFIGFTPHILSAFDTPGVAERWAAVQERLHPQLAVLAEALREQGMRQFPRSWPLYELTFKSLRYVNRGAGERAPIDEYHLALDRPPRGSGIYIAFSVDERLILVSLQVGKLRKNDMRQVWEAGKAVWQPLVERVSDVRFLDDQRGPGGRKARDEGQPIGDAARQQLWIDRFLDNRRATTLLAGFAYRWDDARVAQPAFAQQIIDDVLALFPLNEAMMEQVEVLEPHGAALLRERRALYTQRPLPPIELLVERIRARGFTLPEPLIRAYHVALQTKPLVILPGISGTGKTRLTRLYADAAHDLNGGDNPYYLIVAVQPDWHNARDLLGYYNGLTGTFLATPFLRFLLRAAADPAVPYFVCLDEMNLARPEYYLAPILSALETEDHQIDLGAPSETVAAASGELLPNLFRLPLNVRITGTVNVDESTHTLSDKLLDRANVIELTVVDLEAFRVNYRDRIDPQVWRVIIDVHALMAQAGQPFGYRTVSEMLRYIAQAEGILPRDQAVDQQIKQKILPKLRGDDSPRLRRALAGLLELLLGQPQSVWGKAAAIEPTVLANAPFPESAEKVRHMLERLEREGFTDFYS